MSKERFRISARLMNHLGEALITDELVALMELIKNAYDADANYAEIIVDSQYEQEMGKISIYDDGNGMDYKIITEGFLVLATDFKVKKQKFSPKLKRISLGNKGIGRLSLQRLGDYCEIVTKMENQNAYYFNIDWTQFNDSQKDIYDIEISVEEKPEFNNSFNKGHGTRIDIFKIKNKTLWNENGTFNRFKNEILSILNPYADEKHKFSILMNLNSKQFSSMIYDVSYISSLSDVVAKFNFDDDDNTLSINICRNEKYINYKLKELQKKYEDNFIFNVDVNKIYDKLGKKNIKLHLDTIGKEYTKIKKDDLKLNLNCLPGSFNGEIFAFNKTTGRYSLEEGKYLDIINGVKLFRNNFRILPYGDPQNDWLNFTKYSQTFKANIYKSHTTAGYVYIDGEDNLIKLQEVTNRQGLIQDEYGMNFLNLCGKIISQILVIEDIYLSEKLTAKQVDILKMKPHEEISICDGLIRMTKKEDANQNVLVDSENLLNDTTSDLFDDELTTNIKNQYHNIAKNIVENAKKIKAQSDGYKKIIDDEYKKLDEYKVVIGAALIAETMSHEILRVSSNTSTNVKSIKNELIKKPLNIEKINVLLDSVNVYMNFLHRYASILDFNSYTKKKKREVIDIQPFILNLVKSIPFLSLDNNSNGIHYDLIGDSFEVEIIKSNLIISLENILINSKYWLEKYNIENKNLVISVNGNDKKITIYDNGLGVSKDVENNLFDAFVTAKPEDEGRGMGLYITKSLLSEIGASISLSDERNDNGLLYKFIIQF